MPKPVDDKSKRGWGRAPYDASAPANPTDGTPASGTAPPASGGETPPALEENGGDEASRQRSEGETTQAAGDNKPPAPPTGSGDKKRVKCEDLKGKKVIIGNGEAVQIDENGFFEVDEKEAARLLTIPGYVEA
jgi:hypothetical protein